LHVVGFIICHCINNREKKNKLKLADASGELLDKTSVKVQPLPIPASRERVQVFTECRYSGAPFDYRDD
jgi:hypothetical protein